MGISLPELVVAGALGTTFIIGGVGFTANLLTPIDVHEIGKSMEEWSVSNVTSELPETNGYVEYSEYKNDAIDTIKVPSELQYTLPGQYKAEKKWIKVEVSTADSSFTICTHKGDNANPAGNEIISYDSVTGEEVVNEAEICS